MTKEDQRKPRDPDIIGSEKALKRAAKRALELGIQTGTPVWVMENGKIIDLTKKPGKRSDAEARGTR